MAEIVLAGVGAAVGSLAGGVSILQGAQIGAALQGILFPSSGPRTEQGRVSEVQVGTSSYGAGLPKIYGRFRVPGQLIWLSELREASETRRTGGKKGGGSTTSFEYRADLAVAVCRGPATAIRRIWADADVIYDARDGSPEAEAWLPLDDVAVHLGAADQARDSTIEAAVGTDDCPAYRGLCYVVLSDFDLTRFGNRPPQFSFEVQVGAEVFLDDVLSGICSDLAIPSAQTDFSAVAAIPVIGYAPPVEAAGTEALAELQDIYRFDIVENDGQLTAVPWGSVAAASYDQEDFGLDGDEDWLPLIQGQSAEIPRALDVRYYSEAIDFQPATQSARIGFSSEDSPVLDIPAVLTEDQAATLALIHLIRRHVQRLSSAPRCLPKFIQHAPGDLLEVSYAGGFSRFFTVRGLSMEEGGGIRLALVEDDASIYSLTATGQAPPGSSSGLTEAGDLVYEARGQLPQLADSHNSALLPQPLVYLWAGRERSGWAGLQFGNGDDYLSQQAGFSPQLVRVPSTIGATTSSLAAAPAFNVWDETSTVDVQLTSGALVSRTKLEVYNGANLCLIGTELISFRTATLLSPGVYRLSGLLRGRKGTEAEGGALRASGADFLLVEALPFPGAEGYAAALSAPTYVNRLTGGASEADTTEFRLTEGAALIADIDVPWDDSPFRPYSPAHLKVAVQENGDRLITWTRRVYRQQELFDGGDSPLEYDAERYALAIGGAAAVQSSSYRAFGWDTNLLLLGGAAGSRTPNTSTALTTTSYTVPAATWAGWADGAKKVMVAQVGQLSAIGYLMHGRPAMITTES